MNRALNIDTLGSEVLGSLFTLYREGALMKKASEMELVLVESDLELAFWTRLLSDDYSKVTPRVSHSCNATRDTPQSLEWLLASRMLALSRLVEKRWSWWPTLTCDIKLQTSHGEGYDAGV